MLPGQRVVGVKEGQDVGLGSALGRQPHNLVVVVVTPTGRKEREEDCNK